MGILSDRWDRARAIPHEDIQLLPFGQFWCRSQSIAHADDDVGYDGFVWFDENLRLVEAKCTCDDYRKALPDHLVPWLHGVRVCKHILAAADAWREFQMAMHPVWFQYLVAGSDRVVCTDQGVRLEQGDREIFVEPEALPMQYRTWPSQRGLMNHVGLSVDLSAKTGSREGGATS